MSANKRSQWVPILRLHNKFEALLFSDVLDEHQIPHWLHRLCDESLGSLWQSQQGWGILEAPTECIEQIKALYAQFSVPVHDAEPSPDPGIER